MTAAASYQKPPLFFCNHKIFIKSLRIPCYVSKMNIFIHIISRGMFEHYFSNALWEQGETHTG